MASQCSCDKFVIHNFQKPSKEPSEALPSQVLQVIAKVNQRAKGCQSANQRRWYIAMQVSLSGLCSGGYIGTHKGWNVGTFYT